MKILFGLCALMIASTNVWAQEIQRAVCNKAEGYTVFIEDGKKKFEKDGTEGDDLVFIFRKDKGEVIGGEGTTYVTTTFTENRIVAYNEAPLASNMLTFFPEEGYVLISRQAYWKPFADRITGYIMIANCKFKKGY